MVAALEDTKKWPGILKLSLSRTRYASVASNEPRTGYHLKAFLRQEQGQAFAIPAAHPHPKIWGVQAPRVLSLVVLELLFTSCERLPFD